MKRFLHTFAVMLILAVDTIIVAIGGYTLGGWLHERMR